MLIIKSNGNLDKLNAILNGLPDDVEFTIIVPARPLSADDNESLYLKVRQMGGFFVEQYDDWLWVTDDNWDGDLSGILPSVG